MRSSPSHFKMLIFYYRVGCHLCEAMAAELEPLLEELGAAVEARDVDADPDWARAYGSEVPVLALGDRLLCRHFLDPEVVRRALG